MFKAFYVLLFIYIIFFLILYVYFIAVLVILLVHLNIFLFFFFSKLYINMFSEGKLDFYLQRIDWVVKSVHNGTEWCFI